MKPSKSGGLPERRQHVDSDLVLRGVSKNYGASQALVDVSFEVPSGKVLALFGENGAGKSTLFGILAGSVGHSDGAVLIGGEPYAPRSPREALATGVALVSQELSPCPSLSVAENIVLGNWPGSRALMNPRRSLQRAIELTERFGVDLPVNQRMSDLSVGEIQIVEILRVLNRHARVVLLDEPTAALSAREADLVLKLIRSLSAEGVTVAMVTHRVQEALSVADQVVVLRGGRLVLDAPKAKVTPARVVEHMLGRELLPLTVDSVASAQAGEALRLHDWRKRGRNSLDGVSLRVGEGTIVGLYGVRGAGLESVAAGLAGTSSIDAGETIVSNKSQTGAFKNPIHREKALVRFVPNDRAGAGLALKLPVLTNLLFPVKSSELSTGPIRRKGAERRAARTIISKYGIATRQPQQRVRELSGGNQQKVLMASRLGGNYRVLVVHEPTRGVDIGAREAIHDALRDVARLGRGVLLISSDVDEIVEVCHRAVVLRAGKVVAELTNDDLVVEKLLYAATADEEIPSNETQESTL